MEMDVYNRLIDIKIQQDLVTTISDSGSESLEKLLEQDGVISSWETLKLKKFISRAGKMLGFIECASALMDNNRLVGVRKKDNGDIEYMSVNQGLGFLEFDGVQVAVDYERLTAKWVLIRETDYRSGRLPRCIEVK